MSFAMSIDPYSSPAMNLPPVSRAVDSAISQGVLAQLAGTKPWVRFISVLMFVGVGFMLLGAVGLTAAAMMGVKNSNSGTFPAGMMVGMAIGYGIFAFLYIYPALKLWNYANRIAVVAATGSTADLESALSEQRSFWKFLGILILIMLVLYLVILIGMIALGGFAAFKAQGG